MAFSGLIWGMSVIIIKKTRDAFIFRFDGTRKKITYFGNYAKFIIIKLLFYQSV